MPDDDSADREARRRKKEKRRERAEDAADGAEAAADSGCSVPGCDRISGRGGGGRGGGGRSGGGSGRSGRSGDGCDACDVCDLCDFLLFLRLSTVLLAVACVLPDRGSGHGVAGAGVRALIRGYQRGLSRFTPPCPSTPSCSAYALTAVEALGPRRGLVAAARRIERCR